jgi:hypothetical protein
MPVQANPDELRKQTVHRSQGTCNISLSCPAKECVKNSAFPLGAGLRLCTKTRDGEKGSTVLQLYGSMFYMFDER